MSANRRKFLKQIGLVSGAVATGLPGFSKAIVSESDVDIDGSKRRKQLHNMCGYATPKLDRVRVGIVGLGMRGPGAVERLSFIDNVDINGLCDKYPDRVTKAQNILTKAGLPKAKEYSGEEGWKAMCESKDIDVIYIATPWALHTPMAVYAMNHGKHACVEVPAATTIDECWQLVETSEKTKLHCMMLENCCYDFFELLTLNMTRHGLFGELIHAEGAYIHNLLGLNFQKDTGYADMWRLWENAKHNGNLYPTHGLGPVAQCMNINRGDQMDYLVSVSGADFMMGARAKELAAKDPFYNQFANQTYRGNMNTSIVKTMNGKTIMIQHDVTSPNPYSRIHLIKGTKGIANKYPSPERIAFEDEQWISPEQMKNMYDQYTPEIVKHVGEIAKKVGGHGGMDFLMDWRWVDCLRNGLAYDQDVYDAALWSCISPLSEQSVKNRGKSMDIPDFTRGAWRINKPIELTLKGGATTLIRNTSGSGGNQLNVH